MQPEPPGNRNGPTKVQDSPTIRPLGCWASRSSIVEHRARAVLNLMMSTAAQQRTAQQSRMQHRAVYQSLGESFRFGNLAAS